MEKQLVVVILISIILGALGGSAITYLVLQPQIQSLQPQIATRTWHLVYYANHTRIPEVKPETMTTEVFEIKGYWVKVTWSDWRPYQHSVYRGKIFVISGNQTWKDLYSNPHYDSWRKSATVTLYNNDVVINVAPGEYRLVIESGYADWLAIGVWDYY